MNFEIIKRAISDVMTTTGNVDVVNIDIYKEGNNKLWITINYKDVVPYNAYFFDGYGDVNFHRPLSNFEQLIPLGAFEKSVLEAREQENSESKPISVKVNLSDGASSWLSNLKQAYTFLGDGYCRPIIDFDQQFPINQIVLPKHSEFYKNKMKAAFEKSEVDAKWLHTENTELGDDVVRRQEAKAVDCLKKSILDAEDARILEEVAKYITSVTPDFQEPSENKIVRDNFVATQNTDKYIQALIRSGITPEMAQEIAQRSLLPQPPRVFTQPSTKTTICGDQGPQGQVRTDPQGPQGKIITPIDLPISKQEQTEKPPYPSWKPPYHGIRRQPDGYTTIENDKSRVVDGYQKPRFVKKASEVVAEYKKAVEVYKSRFGRVGEKLNPDEKGKRGVNAVSVHAQPFHTNNRKVTDVEVMFLANEKMANLIDPPSLLKDLKEILAKIPRPTKLQKILFHLNSIKAVILRK